MVIKKSPNGSFLCYLGKTQELNKAAFGCKGFFTNSNKHLIYYKKETFFHELHSHIELEKVKKGQMLYENKIENLQYILWSNQGNMVYFLEYSWDVDTNYYYSVFLDFKNNLYYRIFENKNN